MFCAAEFSAEGFFWVTSCELLAALSLAREYKRFLALSHLHHHSIARPWPKSGRPPVPCCKRTSTTNLSARIPGWHFSLRNPSNQAPDHQVAAVALTQDSGQVLRIWRAVRTRWTEGPGRGQLRLQYDYYQLPNSNGVTMSSSIIDLRARHRSSIQPRNKVHSGYSAGRVAQLHRRVKSPHSTTTTLARNKAVLPPTHGIAS